MGIFSSISNAIFGGGDESGSTGNNTSVTGAMQDAVASANQAAAAQAASVDVEAVLAAKPGADKLNWKTSIADLMRLLDLDPSYENRKELAQEMGNTDYSGSAEDNILLHRQVMQKIAQNGGRVPADMLN